MISATAYSVEKYHAGMETLRKVQRRIQREWQKYDRPLTLSGLRLFEIERIIKARHGGIQIPDPTGTDDLQTCLAYLAAGITSVEPGFLAWVQMVAPWALGDSYKQDLQIIIDAAEQRKADKTGDFDADAVAKILNVTFIERTRLELRTIGCNDLTKEQRIAIAKEKKRGADRKRQAAKRRRNPSYKPRAEIHAGSLETIKPWVEAGISRATYFRRLNRSRATAERETDASPIYSLIIDEATHQSQTDQGLMDSSNERSDVGCGDLSPRKDLASAIAKQALEGSACAA